jgi:hypothetical protein
MSGSSSSASTSASQSVTEPGGAYISMLVDFEESLNHNTFSHTFKSDLFNHATSSRYQDYHVLLRTQSLNCTLTVPFVESTNGRVEPSPGAVALCFGQFMDAGLEGGIHVNVMKWIEYVLFSISFFKIK